MSLKHDSSNKGGIDIKENQVIITNPCKSIIIH